MNGDHLTPKQGTFVREYLIDYNATQAAIRAGYSARWAEKNSARLTGNDGVQARIAALERKAAASSEKTADDVRAKLVEIAWAKDDKGVSMRDRLKALELYAKYIGMDRESRKEALPIFHITMVTRGEKQEDKKPAAFPPGINASRPQPIVPSTKTGGSGRTFT